MTVSETPTGTPAGGGDKRNGLIRWLESVRSGEIGGGPG